MQNKTLIIILAVVAVIVLSVVSIYNSLVRLNTAVDGAWAQVETQYQRRFDLIPGLVESVKAVLKQEQTVFKDIADARANYAGAKGVDAKVAAANQVESALGRLLVITENYPQLKSSETVQTFMSQLEGTENRVSVERGRFNDAVSAFNIKAQTFPTNMIASVFGFKARTFFKSDTGAEKAPKVDLGL